MPRKSGHRSHGLPGATRIERASGNSNRGLGVAGTPDKTQKEPAMASLTVGYDDVTGVGSPNGVSFLLAVAGGK